MSCNFKWNNHIISLVTRCQRPLYPPRYLSAATSADGDPASLSEALSGPDGAQWHAAKETEINTLRAKHTWDEVTTVPPERKLIGCRWVCKRKVNAQGEVVVHKVRLVAQGFSQQPGLDYEATFAPVGRITSLRLLLTITAAYDLELYQADVQGAYLNGDLDRDIYMRLPNHYTPLNPNAIALKLNKTLYGLKQSGREWWKAIMLVYVDDLVIAARNISTIDNILNQLSSKWTLSSLGPATYVLGMRITRNRPNKTIVLSQTAYINTLLKRYPGFSTTIAKHAPLPSRKLEEDDFETPAVLTPYQELVGSLLWLAGCTRPDIAFSASFLARYTASPTEGHWQLALRVLSYLSHTQRLGIMLGGVKHRRTLTCYSDADWAGCGQTARSTTGYVTYFCGSPISWCSKRQRTTASSTMEAEYIAASEATREVIWLRNRLQELYLPQVGPSTLLVDNEAAINLSKNPLSHNKSKHIDVRYHVFRERVELGDITVEYIPTDKQRADVFTKALGGPAHGVAIRALRMEKIHEEGEDSKEENA
ncbi:hypothetical protein LQV05_004409 [Cryptococcus neoformans]|nr:hypothetical protein LQV05_004409 [Cryptococcus neoformans]